MKKTRLESSFMKQDSLTTKMTEMFGNKLFFFTNDCWSDSTVTRPVTKAVSPKYWTVYAYNHDVGG